MYVFSIFVQKIRNYLQIIIIMGEFATANIYCGMYPFNYVSLKRHKV